MLAEQQAAKRNNSYTEMVVDGAKNLAGRVTSMLSPTKTRPGSAAGTSKPPKRFDMWELPPLEEESTVRGGKRKASAATISNKKLRTRV